VKANRSACILARAVEISPQFLLEPPSPIDALDDRARLIASHEDCRHRIAPRCRAVPPIIVADHRQIEIYHRSQGGQVLLSSNCTPNARTERTNVMERIGACSHSDLLPEETTFPNNTKAPVFASRQCFWFNWTKKMPCWYA
jgi:hypothetical protein